MEKQTFSAVIQSADRGGAFVTIPFDVEATFGSKRPKVQVLFDEQESYRGTLVRMKSPQHLLIVRKDIRETLKKNVGDTIDVQVWLDTEPRKVEIPALLQERFLNNTKAETFFKQLSYTCQKEYANYITEAKRESTQIRRADKVIDMLLQEIKTPY